MKSYFIRNWYSISVFISGLVSLIFSLRNWSASQSMILVSLIFIFLHFFEEFGFPGGFAGIAIKVELNIDVESPIDFPLNHVNAWFGNWWYAFAVYFLPLVFPKWNFMTLSVALFAFAELIMHGILFPICIKKIYNAGLLTTVIGLVPTSIIFLINNYSQFCILDYLYAFLWIVLNYWIAFRSPIYHKMEKFSKIYYLSDDEAFGKNRENVSSKHSSPNHKN